ncbi:MAG: HD family phosphohydrolase [Clostridia bacterium]
MVEIFRSIYRIYNKYFLRKPVVKKGLILVSSFLVIWLVAVVSIIPKNMNVDEGDLSENTIYAPFDIENEIATNRNKQKAIDSVPDAYVRDMAHEENVYENLNLVLTEIVNEEELPLEELRDKLTNLGDGSISQRIINLSNNSIRYIQQLEEDEFGSFSRQSVNILKTVYDDGIGTIERGHQLIDSEIENNSLPDPEKKVIREVLYTVFSPSYQYSEELTSELREEARANVKPVIVRKGDVLVYEGQIIDNESIEMLKVSGFINGTRRQQMILGLGLFLLIVLSLSFLTIITFSKEVFNKVSNLSLFFLVLVLGYIASSLLVNISPYLIVGIALAVIIAVLLDWKPAVIMLLTHNFLVIPMLIDNYLILTSITIGGLVAIAISDQMNQRSDMVRIAIGSAAMQTIFLFSMYLYNGNLSGSGNLFTQLSISGVSSMTFVIIAIGSLPFFENLFGIISSVRLLELSNPNRKLLRKMQKEAPGTYNHSLIVANLAEVAADAVGANALLARVGAYYHDIGKLKRPQFFVENQLTEENPHEKYEPSLSALIISSHVKDGVEIAKEYKLPKQIIDIIEQHHSESTVNYFYHKALNSKELEKTIKRKEYQYDGPKPKTKEAAIVMLADTVEAAVRSLQRRTPSKVEELVKKLVKDKLEDGELDKCDLTFKDIDTMIKTFTQSLSGVYHSRIAYPEKSIADLERSRKLGRHSNK